jgi:4-amino-4-deoxy-L-arabinose transferase-like glycosyltransferase
MNYPNPALVSQRAAARLPRPALQLFCAAYVLPGMFGRDPWKGAEISAFGYMANIARGAVPWLQPTVAELPGDGALLPYWLGAAFIKLLSPWADPALAARIPFAMLLVLTLVLIWYTTYHLARTEAAQPLPFAFGGEASPVDYARAIADGAVLALMACLGLLQLGHETTPELVQLVGVTLLLYALASSPYRAVQSKLAALVALPALAASNAPSIALALAITGTLICRNSSYPQVRAFAPWVVASGLLAGGVAGALGAWAWRLGAYAEPKDVWGVVRLLAWFTWPALPLALWTLWRWRAHLLNRHIAIPLGLWCVALVASIVMGGSDRALMLGLPALAVLAAFSLPTLRRSTAAAIDWFSVFFFTICAVAIWVIYLSMHTGVPAKPAANVARLAEGLTPVFSAPALLFAVLASLAWMWLVHWRTGRNRHPLWKSLVLPASGVALCWLLLMTLLLPPLDHARSYRTLVHRIGQHIPPDVCIAAPGLPRGQLAAMEYLGRYRVDALTPLDTTPCEFALQFETPRSSATAPENWMLLARAKRNRNDDESTAIYRRTGPSR